MQNSKVVREQVCFIIIVQPKEAMPLERTAAGTSGIFSFYNAEW